MRDAATLTLCPDPPPAERSAAARVAAPVEFRLPPSPPLKFPTSDVVYTTADETACVFPLVATADPVEDDYAIIGDSAAIQVILDQARRVAASKVCILIEGETGTGKELVARLIHRSSPRACRPFIRLNCASLSETLAESELFGHEKGAFTGAIERSRGRFELADGGTLLLDEISEMSAKLQAKLLRVLEEEEFERVGGGQTQEVDVRVLATTNRNLEREVGGGRFRGDLYYRLNAVHLKLPPLRARRADIRALADHFFARYRQEADVPLRGVAAKTHALLTAYDWPGNVRQLRNVIHRACILARGPEIQPIDLPPLEELDAHTGPADTGLAGRTLAEIECQVILDTLRGLGGNRTATAARLGVTTRTLLNKLNKYRELGLFGTVVSEA